MKNIRLNSIVWAVAGLFALASCDTDPLADEIAEIKASTSIEKDVTYTLTEDDYDFADDECDCVNSNSFGNEDDAKDNIPLILADVFPGLGDGSSVLATYNLFQGFTPDSVDPWVDAANDDRYTVTSSDYYAASSEAGDAGFFNNTTTFEDNVQAILSAGISSPSDGDLVVATYDYAQIEYADLNFTELYAEDFTGFTDLADSDLQAVSVVGDQEWHKYVSSFPYEAARISGFSGGSNQVNEDWLITSQIDLTGFNNAELKVENVVAFLGSAVWGTDIGVRISSDYDGVSMPSTATWDFLEFNREPTTDDGFDPFETKASLADYGDQQVYLAFYYTSTVDFAPNWRVIDINVSQGDEIDIDTRNVFYTYDDMSGEWNAAEDAPLFLSSSAYDEMGLLFPNFSSSVSPEDYLPQYLRIHQPYAQEGDEQAVVYDYFSSSSGAQSRADFYTFTGGTWVEYQSTVETTFSFGNKDGEWVPDNTIKYTLGSADYSAIAAAYETLNSAGASSMSTFGNYDLTLWSSQEIFDSITARLEEIFPTVVDQKYLVEYAVWRPGSGTEELHVVWNGSAYVLVQ